MDTFDGIPQYENGVIKLDAVPGRMLAGYIFGGIKALIPNITPSSASNRLFKVYVQPQRITSSEYLSTIHFSVFPNPYTDAVSIRLPYDFNPRQASIVDFQGRSLRNWGNMDGLKIWKNTWASYPRGFTYSN